MTNITQISSIVQAPSTVQRFLSAFSTVKGVDESFNFRAIKYKGGVVASESGTIFKAFDTLVKANDKGAEVYFMPNVASAYTADSVTAYRCLCTDLDNGLPEDGWHEEPTIVIETSRGRYQAYWILESPLPNTSANALLYKDATDRLRSFYNGDKAVGTPSQLMRVAGFSHCKREPYLSDIFEYSPDFKYQSFDQVSRGLPEVREEVKPLPDVDLAVVDAALNRAFTSEPKPYYFATSAKERARDIIKSSVLGVDVNVKLNQAAFILGRAINDSNKQELTNWIHALADSHLAGTSANLTKAHARIDQGLSDGILFATPDFFNVDNLLTINNTVVNARYMPDICEVTARIIGLKAGMGTGKSKVMADFGSRFVRALTLSTRKTLVYDKVKEGYKRYDDVHPGTGLGSIDRLSSTLDSLPKFGMDGEEFKPYDCVTLDEIDQLLEYLFVGETLKGKRKHCVAIVRLVLRKAKTILLASATLSDYEIKLVCALSGLSEEEVKTFTNENKPTPRDIYRYEKPEVCYESLYKDIDEGKKLWVNFDTKTDAEALQRELNNRHPELAVLCVTSDNSGSFAKALENTDSFVQTFDVVVSSPSFSAGVDVNCSHFHRVYGFYSNTDVPYTDCLQGLGRVRNPIDNQLHIYVSPIPGKPESSIEAIRHKFNVDHGDFELLEVDPDTLALVRRKDELSVLITSAQEYYLAKREVNCRWRKQKLFDHLENQGHTLTDISSDEDLTHVKEQLKLTKDEVKALKVKEVLEAGYIDADELDRISNLTNRTQAQQLQLTKAFALKAVVKEETPAELTNDEVMAYVYGKQALQSRVLKILAGGRDFNRGLDIEDLQCDHVVAFDRDYRTRTFDIISEGLSIIDKATANNAQGKVNKSNLEAWGFKAYLSKHAERLRQDFAITVHLERCLVSASMLLELTAHTVEKSKGGKGVRAISYHRTPEQQQLIDRIHAKYSPEAKALKLKESQAEESVF